MSKDDSQASIRGWFDEFTARTGEKVTHVCLSWGDSWRTTDDYYTSRWGDISQGVALPFDEVPAATLDAKFDDGFGGNESPNLCAWSENWVLFSDDYDGAESIRWVPRSPRDHEPVRPGGG